MMRSDSGMLENRPGYRKLSSVNPGVRIMGVKYFRNASAADRSVAATKTGIWRFDGTNWVQLTGTALTGSDTDHVRFQTFSVSGV